MNILKIVIDIIRFPGIEAIMIITNQQPLTQTIYVLDSNIQMSYSLISF